MLRPGQAVRVNLAGMQVGSFRFPRGGHRRRRHDCASGLRRSCVVFGQAPFLVPWGRQSGSAGESDCRKVRANHPQEVSHDQRAGHTAHPGTHPRGYRRFFGRPSGSIGFRLGGAWKAWLRIAALVLILGLFMLLEEQVLSSASVSYLVRHPSLVGVVDGSHPPVLNLFCSNKRFLRDFRASGLPPQ